MSILLIRLLLFMVRGECQIGEAEMPKETDGRHNSFDYKSIKSCVVDTGIFN